MAASVKLSFWKKTLLRVWNGFLIFCTSVHQKESPFQHILELLQFLMVQSVTLFGIGWLEEKIIIWMTQKGLFDRKFK